MIVVVILIMAAILIWIITKSSKQEKRQLEEQEERLDDEFIYVSGKRLTLEEAENSIVVVEESEIDRIKSDSEIENNYFDDNKEIEYIRRDFIRANSPGIDPGEITYLINKSQLFKELKSFEILDLWRLRPDLLAGLINLSYDYLNARSKEIVFETQPIVVIHGRENIQKLVALQNVHKELVEDSVIVRQPKRVNYKEFKKLIEIIVNSINT